MIPLTPSLLVAKSFEERDEDCACPDKAFVLSIDTAADQDTDCACPDRAFALRPRLESGFFFTQTPQVHIDALPHGFHLAFSAFASGGPSVLNASAWERWQSFGVPQSLARDIDQALLAQGLIHLVDRPPRTVAGQPETLTAWLHVTNACNLDCPYCYVRKSSAQMNEVTGLNAVQAVFDTAEQRGFQRVKLKYAGGEATLHFQLVRRLHERARELAAESELGLKEVVLTNGVHLRPDDADWLAENKIKLMVSVDGVGELHDQLRPNKGGGRSFAHVQRTVDEVLLPRGLRPDVTMTVTRANAHGAADVAYWAMIERGLPLSFNFYRQNPLSASRTDLALEETAIIEGMLAAYTIIEQHLPTLPFFNGLLDRVQAEAHSHTCGVGQSYVVVTHTGQLAQCQMHLDQPVSPNINGDLLPLVASGPIRNLSVDAKTGCRDCVYRYRCSGGCPLETFRATGRWDVQSPNCNIYQALLPHALRLEGLRLMKTNGYLM